MEESPSQADGSPRTEPPATLHPLDRLRLSWCLAIVLLVYLATYAPLPKNGFWINDNECKFIQVQGVLRTHATDFSIPWPGRELDPDFKYNPLIEPFGRVVDRRLYCFYPPVFALVSALPYRLLGFAGLYLVPIVSALLTLPAVWYMAGFLSARRRARPLAVFVVAFATPVWFYSMTFWEHMPSVCLATWSMAFCMGYLVRQRVRQLGMSALCCGLAIYFRDDLYILGAVVAVVAAIYGRRRRWRDVALFAAAFAGALMPLWAFQWMALGHPLGHHFIHGSPLESGIAQHAAERWAVARNLLINCHELLFLSLVVSAPYLVFWLIYPRLAERMFRWTVPLLASAATVGGLIVMAGHLRAVSPMWYLLAANSLFAVSPILILAFVRQRKEQPPTQQNERPDGQARNQRALWLILSLYVLLYLLLAPRANSGGVHWACRFLMPAYPLLGVMAASTVVGWWQGCGRRMKVGKVLLGAAVGLSVATQVYSLQLLWRRKAFSTMFNTVIAQRPEEVIIAANWAIPQYLSHCFFDKKIFLLHHRDDFTRLNDALRRAGERNAVLVNASRPVGDAILRDPEELHDGNLNYISFRAWSVRLGDGP